MDINTRALVGAEAPARWRTKEGKLVTRENIDSLLIDSGYFTYEQVYGE